MITIFKKSRTFNFDGKNIYILFIYELLNMNNFNY